MIKPILQLGNETLREQSTPWDNFQSNELTRLIKDLSDTLRDARRRYEYGRGIAAPQIDTLKRVICVETPAFKGPLINPTIIWESGQKVEIWDSCFSFSVAFFVLVDRTRNVKVQYFDSNGTMRLLTADSDLAELLQHELDHLDGILAIDRMKNNKMMMHSEWQRTQNVRPNPDTAAPERADSQTA
jgi:peptide deformylase